MKIKVMKFGGTSVATSESRLIAARKVIVAKENGFDPVVVVSAIGRKGAPYATETLLSMLREVDALVPPEPREVDLMLCCGEIMSTCIFAQTLKSLGHPASAMTGGQAGLVTDDTFGNARILEVQPDGVLAVLKRGRIPVVCGFQGRSKASEEAVYGEITTLGRGGSDTTASALGAALGAVAVEIYTDVDGVKTCDPNMVPTAPTLRTMTYEEIAEIAHQGAKVVHPRAAEIAMKFDIPLWIKCTFTDEPGTEVVRREEFPGRRVTGITHTGKLVYLQFEAPFGADKAVIESKVYQLMADFRTNLFMLNVHPNGFGFAVPREQLSQVKEILDGLVVPIAAGAPAGNALGQIAVASAKAVVAGIERKARSESVEPQLAGESSQEAETCSPAPSQVAAVAEPLSESIARTYIIQIGRAGSTEVKAQERMLKGLSQFGEIRKCVAKLTEDCTMVSIVAHEFLQQPGIYLRTMQCLHNASIHVLQTSDSPLSLSLLISETDCERAVRVLYKEFELAEAI